MKIAISSHDGKKESGFSARFGRCEYFVLFDAETKSWEAKPNPAADAKGGAGALVVQFLSDLGVDVIITGRYGPTAFTAIEAAKIRPYQATQGTPEELVDQFFDDKLTLVHASTGPGLH